LPDWIWVDSNAMPLPSAAGRAHSTPLSNAAVAKTPAALESGSVAHDPVMVWKVRICGVPLPSAIR
jgi:hypothetical protein